ncbi:MAG: hypothetical protein LQ352_001414 [Teloschistes flavicans]|nr:MAG: hypothetical protein LQ352_001414 [Teloschistes flavicans]
MRLSPVFSSLFYLSALSAPSLALPAVLTLAKRTSGSLVTIAPKASTCAGAEFAKECKTAEEAAPFINQSFRTYGITTPGEAAALLSTMAFESDDFRYNINHVPGVPGQGTRNMQSPQFNMMYAQSLKLAAGGSDPSAVLAQLTANPQYDFGSGAWFLTTQCSDTVRAGLKTGQLTGWQAYISECIHTAASPDRQAYWERAAKVMGISTK